MLRLARTHSISIARPPEDVLAFVASIEEWPRWAVLTVKSVKRVSEGWVLCGVEGERPLTLTLAPEQGLMDYRMGDWNVAMRVVANGEGSEVVATFVQPLGMEEREFEQAVNVRERELKALKVVLERQNIRTI